MGMAENQNIISIPWDYNMVMRAHKKAKELGGIKNSILKGGGNAAGYLGEEINTTTTSGLETNARLK